MFADRLSAFALLAAFAIPAAAAEVGSPLTVEDLVRLERLSEPVVAPDGKRVAYTLRTTDIEANKGRTGIWLLDTRKRGAAAVRLTDLAANAGGRHRVRVNAVLPGAVDTPMLWSNLPPGGAQWSADGNSLYFLSNRSGSNQVWRRDVRNDNALKGDALQVTALPFDVESFRVSPTADRIIVSLEVFIDCPDLACTKQRLDAAAHSPAHGVLYDKLFVRHWDAWSDGRRSQLFGIALDASGISHGTPVNLSGNIDGDVPGKPFGGREDYAFSPNGPAAVSRRISPRTIAPGTDSPPFRPTARSSPTSPWSARALKPTVFISCCSTSKPASSVRSPRIGIDRSRALRGPQTARPCSRPRTTWDNTRCGQSTQRRASPPRSPARVRSKASPSGLGRCSTRTVPWGRRRTCTAWASAAAPPSGSPILIRQSLRAAS